MERKQLQDPEQTQRSLLALRDELSGIYLGRSGEVPTIIMKINSCLYGRYPNVKERKSDIADERKSGENTGEEIFYRDLVGTTWRETDENAYAERRRLREAGKDMVLVMDNNDQPSSDRLWGTAAIRVADTIIFRTAEGDQVMKSPGNQSSPTNGVRVGEIAIFTAGGGGRSFGK